MQVKHESGIFLLNLFALLVISLLHRQETNISFLTVANAGTLGLSLRKKNTSHHIKYFMRCPKVRDNFYIYEKNVNN